MSTHLTEAQRLAFGALVAEDLAPAYAALQQALLDVRTKRGLRGDETVMRPYFDAAAIVALAMRDARSALTSTPSAHSVNHDRLR